jgi:hypothetical protein
MNELVNTVEYLYTTYQVAFIIIGVVVIVIGCLLLALVVYGIVYICMKSCCCEVTYNVNSPQKIQSRKISEPILIPSPPPPPPPTPATSSRIDMEKKKKEEKHPKAVRAGRQQVMFLDEKGNIPVYTLRSRSVDGHSGGYTTIMNMDVRPKKYQETEV